MEFNYQSNHDFLQENKQENENVSESSYSVTAILCFFLGIFGAHRLYNGRKASGITMLVINLILVVVFIILFGMMLSEVLTDGDEFKLGIIAMLMFLILLIISIFRIWSFIDLIIILCGKFKNNSGEYVRSKKPFFKTGANYIIIILLVLSMIVGLIIGFASYSIFSESYAQVLADGALVEEMNDEVSEIVLNNKERKAERESKNDSVDTLEECLSVSNYDEVLNDREEFVDELDQYLESLGYDKKEFYSDGSDRLLFSRKDDFGYSYKLNIAFGEGEASDIISSCYFKVDYEGFEESDRHNYSSVESKNEGVVEIYHAFEDDEDKYTVNGNYEVDSSDFNITLYENLEYEDAFEYDTDYDLYDIMEIIDIIIMVYFEEYDVIFK